MANDQLPKLAILGGTGDQGSGLALRWALAGYPVTIGSRSAERASKHVNSLNEQYKTIKMVGDSNRGAAVSAEMVILTVPFKVQRTTVVEVRDLLDNKILIDVTVPLVPPRVARAQLPVGGSAVAGIQELLGQSVKVVSAFQNVSAEHLQHVDEPIDCDVLIVAGGGGGVDIGKGNLVAGGGLLDGLTIELQVFIVAIGSRNTLDVLVGNGREHDDPRSAPAVVGPGFELGEESVEARAEGGKAGLTRKGLVVAEGCNDYIGAVVGEMLVKVAEVGRPRLEVDLVSRPGKVPDAELVIGKALVKECFEIAVVTGIVEEAAADEGDPRSRGQDHAWHRQHDRGHVSGPEDWFHHPSRRTRARTRGRR